MSMVYKANYKILYNRLIVSRYYLMGLESDGLGKFARPGQFVYIRCSDGFDPLLRRPFSIHRLRAQGSGLRVLEILYEVVGKGTKILSEKKSEERLDIIGPLGNGFDLPRAQSPEPRALLIAGGMGVAPLAFLVEELAKRRIKIIVLIGARTKKLILFEKDFKKLGAEVHIATDDGTYGFKGSVSELFKWKLSTINYQLSTIFACGPKPMLKQISEICRRNDLPCQISLEENMGCGLGACLGCVVETTQGYKRVCKDGPVFDAEEILWN